MKLGFNICAAAVLFTLAIPARADQKLVQAVGKALNIWNSYHFVIQDFQHHQEGVKVRYDERTAEGDYQRDETSVQGKWRYTVTMDENYKFPQPGEVTDPMNGDFIVLPDGNGIDSNAFHRRKGETAWRKVDRPVNSMTLASEVQSKWRFQALTLGSTDYLNAPSKGTFPVFGAPQVQGKKCAMYQVEKNGYTFAYWLDTETGDLVQMSAQYMPKDARQYTEIMMVFLNPNKPVQPAIQAPR